jgi:hypothetical protein
MDAGCNMASDSYHAFWTFLNPGVLKVGAAKRFFIGC